MNVNPLNNAPPRVAEPATGRAAPPSGANPANAGKAAPAQSATLPGAPATADDVRQAAKQVNQALKQTASADLQFSVEGENKQVVVRVVDSQTKELIRQIPSEEMVAISKAMDNMTGLLVQQKA